jgi:hypothetical protein
MLVGTTKDGLEIYNIDYLFFMLVGTTNLDY